MITSRTLRRSALTALTLVVPLLAAPAVADPAPTTAGSVAPAARQVTVMQYNIRFGEKGLGGVAEDIRRTGADVVLLNEVDDRSRTGGRDQARFLARELGMRYVYDENTSTRFGTRGNAVLTRFEINFARRWDLPRADGTEQRGLMKVRIRAGKLRFDAWSTHLHFGVGKLAQARAVRRIIGDPGCATILGGDVNATPDSAEHAALTRHLRDVWNVKGEGNGGTTKDGRRRIDYLFHDLAEPQSVYVTPLRNSDHRAVVGTFAIDRAANGC